MKKDLKNTRILLIKLRQPMTLEKLLSLTQTHGLTPKQCYVYFDENEGGLFTNSDTNVSKKKKIKEFDLNANKTLKEKIHKFINTYKNKKRR